ncbi:hypothetical protein H7U37_01875 [Pseudoflavonifractor phocaeensis]|uniref:hypothetical protein n=1 Tax=Pseudoflavonifractor phocaeensis TaxID=1870988 RepID=UPI00195DAADE|nr:hypothetical protein [Pseudoflavonifractor phocaeensis]MBM6937276.1 hypothetical protein [Pseudoflavonifractor phocaeensis]
MIIAPVIVFQAVHALNRSAHIGGTVSDRVKIPQNRVNGKAGLLQRLFERGGFAGVDIGRSGAAGGDVSTGAAEQADSGAVFERQGVVVVSQQHGAFAGELFGHLFIMGLQRFNGSKVTFKVDCVLVFVFDFICIDVKGDVDRLSSAKGDIAGDEGGDEQNGAYGGQNRPEQCPGLA